MTIFTAALSIVLISLLIVQTAAAYIRLYKKAYGCNILRTFLRPRGKTIILIIISVIMTVIACIAFSKAVSAQNASDSWKLVQLSAGSDQFQERFMSEYEIAERSGINEFVRGKITENTVSAVSYALCGVSLILIALEFLLLIFGDIFYITESGFISRDTEDPEHITASRLDDKLVVFFDNGYALIEIKATSENMNKFSKFVEVEMDSAKT